MTAEPEEVEDGSSPTSDSLGDLGGEKEEPTAEDAESAEVDETPEPPPESQPEPPVDTQPEPQPTPAPAPAPAAAPWTPPDTFSEKFSRTSGKLIRFSIGVCSILWLLVIVLWAVPTVLVTNSTAYTAAKRHVENDRELRSFLGGPLVCEKVPSRYRLEGNSGRFAFAVQGFYGNAFIDAKVEDGKVVSAERIYTIDSTRPLADQLEGW